MAAGYQQQELQDRGGERRAGAGQGRGRGRHFHSRRGTQLLLTTLHSRRDSAPPPPHPHHPSIRGAGLSSSSSSPFHSRRDSGAGSLRPLPVPGGAAGRPPAGPWPRVRAGFPSRRGTPGRSPRDRPPGAPSRPGGGGVHSRRDSAPPHHPSISIRGAGLSSSPPALPFPFAARDSCAGDKRQQPASKD